MTTTHTAPGAQIDLDSLEKLARDIESTGAWDFDTHDESYRIAGGEVVGGDPLPCGDVYTIREWETCDGSECLTIAHEVGTQFGRYIAALDPPTVLILLALARAGQQAGEAAGDVPSWCDRSWAHGDPRELDPEDHVPQMLAEIADLRIQLVAKEVEQRRMRQMFAQVQAQLASAKLGATQWSKKPPTEQGEYWNWDGNEDNAPMIYHVLWSGTAKKCFVSMGQYGIDEAIWCDNFGGWWIPIEQPALPDAARAHLTNTTGETE